jgi:4,5:9,10-diseco-3-hydroxy-5,9,17-trioxoandrosta-1(10),2-diene-4-oate hydrolase
MNTIPSQRAHAGAPADCRQVVVDGVRLAVDDSGDGPAIVCLHAIGHGAADFARLRRRLAPRWRVLAPDWPGQGRSAADREPPRAARYAALLDGLLDTCGVGRAVILGNSIGGAAALRYAAARPERVAALVLENPGGLDRTDDPLARTVIRAMVAFFDAGARGASWFPAAFAAYYRLVLQRAAAAEHRRRIVASAREIAPLLRDAWTGFGEPDADVRHLAPAIRCPVLVAWAARDQVIQLRRCRPALRSFADARLETFPAGHAPHLETPDAFEATLERFLEPLGRADAPADAARTA